MEPWYCHIRTALDAETSSSVSHALRRVDSKDLYDQLKSFLIKTFSQSQYQRAKQLLGLSKLGDRSPLQLTDYIWQTLGDNIQSILILQIFCHTLRAYVQDALMTFKTMDLDWLTEEVELIMYHPCCLPNVCQASATPPAGPGEEDSDDVKPPSEVCHISCPAPQHSRTHRHPSPPCGCCQASPEDGKCYYHSRLGAAARQ